ncbi:MAG TPA: glycoside hydrolase family 15 protein [Polyangia bacterium]|jgi:GH15 family glucan-1,4-alpha-glucosidase|nr:glycoside hydrolase family 15 protein [Polyangia bacterium]
MAYQPIENYGIIGDLRTVALVGIDGSIDFMAFPRFDSPTIFAALLDDEKGGRFQIVPTHLSHGRQKQLYLPDSNVLLTRFLFTEGVAEISDFMPVGASHQPRSLIRRVKTVRGEIAFRMLCAPRFDYGRASHRVETVSEREVLFVSEGQDRTALLLHSDVPLRVVDGAAVAEFTLRGDEKAGFVLEEARPGRASCASQEHYLAENFKRTNNFWRSWVARSTYQGRWREMIHRSALTLKLLTSSEYGSTVAAATFGLPEEIGGERNWDYRYTWIRDASFTLYALIRLGYTDEAAAFMNWIEARCGELKPDGSLQIMYGIDGRHELVEETLEHWEGYRRSRPVRVGNGAALQLQLDIYGELMDSVYLYNKYGQPISHDLWLNLTRLVDFVCRNWRRTDEGIWEVRSGQQEFLFSRVMCWVAVDRAIRLAQKRSFPAPLAEWHAVRDQIYGDIFANFWDAQRRTFVQRKGARDLDAASLLIPLIKLISPTDPRWLSTLRAIEKDLVQDSHVFRYVGNKAGLGDGLSGHEGTFNMCSFWYVEALARAGELDKARFIFEKALGYANHLGLYAEELGPSGEHLGNYPQAFSHLGLISAAYFLDRELTRARRPG